MKRLTTSILLMLVAYITEAQRTDDSSRYINYRNQYGSRMPRGWWDSVAHMPYGDTANFAKPQIPGAIMMHTDKNFYKWEGAKWSALGGVVIPAGTNGYLQYNQNGVFGAAFKWDSATKRVYNINYLSLTRLANYPQPDTVARVGDSHTFGIGASPTDSGYSLLETSFLKSLSLNLAVSGTGALSAANRHLINVNPWNSYATVMMVGFNNPRYAGGLPRKTLNKVINGNKAIIVNHFLKSFTNAGTGGTGVTRNGTWTNVWSAAAEGGKTTAGAYTSTTGDYIEYTFNDTTVVVGLMGGDGVSGSSYIGTDINVYIDGLLVATINTNNQTDGIGDASSLDNARCAMAFIYDGLSSGSHTIRLTKQSTGGGGFMICDYFGHLRDANSSELIAVHHIPKMTSAGYAEIPTGSSDAITDTINVKIDSLSSYFINRGYPIVVVPTNTVYNPNTEAASDGIHIANKGQLDIALLMQQLVNDMVSPPDVEGTFYWDNKPMVVTAEGPKEVMLRGEINGGVDQIAYFKTPSQITSDPFIKRMETAEGKGLEISNDGTGLGAANGAVLDLYLKHNATPRLGEFHFYGTNSIGDKTQMAAMYAEAESVTDGAENGMLLMNITANGTVREVFRASNYFGYAQVKIGDALHIDEGNHGVSLGEGANSPITTFKYQKSVNGQLKTGIVNNSTGTNAYAEFQISSDVTLAPGESLRMGKLNSNWPGTTGEYRANSAFIESDYNLQGGLSLATAHPSASLRFYTNGSTASEERLKIDPNGDISILNSRKFYITGVASSTDYLARIAVTGLSGATDPKALQLDASGATNGIALQAIGGTGSTGRGITATGGEYGVNGLSLTGAGLVGNSFNNANAEPGVRAVKTGNSGSSAQALKALELRRETFGAVANNIGLTQNFSIPFDGGYADANTVISQLTNITGATLRSRYTIRGVYDSVFTDVLVIEGNGNTSVTGNLEHKASLSKKVTSITSNTTLTGNEYYIRVNATGGNVTITLPSASSSYNSTNNTGKEFRIKLVAVSGGNTVTIQGAGGDTVDGGTITLSTLNQNVVIIASSTSTWDANQ